MDLSPVDSYGISNYWSTKDQVERYVRGLHYRLRERQEIFFKMGELRGGTFVGSSSSLFNQSISDVAAVNNNLTVTNSVITNWGNFYMDMAYNGHPDERGLDWGGYVDESVSFSMLPFSIYRSLRADGAGNPVDLDAAEKGKTVLTVEGRKNILGVQGQLFAETIRSFNGVEYLLFPKIMGLAERGWNAYPAWEELRGAQEQQAFNKALALYYEKISDMEMPYWARNGINFRLPHPGLLVKDGKLYANVAIRGAEIRYTTDGSEPDTQSALWEAPVPCHAPVVKAKTFCQGKESLPITLKTE